MKQVFDWFESLEQRERLLVSIGVIFVLLTLFYLLLLEPTANRLKNAKNKHVAAQELLSFMQQTKTTVDTLKKQPRATKQMIAPENLLSYLDSSMKRYGINTQLNSISPGKDSGANLRFDNVEYNKLMQWLGNLYFQNGINVESINIAPTKNPGMVKATMLVM